MRPCWWQTGACWRGGRTGCPFPARITLAREGDGWRKLPGSKLIYVRLEADDSVRREDPHFCARCSRLALSLGVQEWVFALSDSLVGYSAADYDQIAQLSW
jgi:hypothetical protein